MLFSTLHSSYETYVRTHITYFAFDLNDNSYTANAQTIDSATSQFFFFNWQAQWYIHFPKYMPFLNWGSLHARLNSHYEAWSYKKKKHKEDYRKEPRVQKEPTVKRCQLILDVKPLRSQFKGKHSIDRESQSLAVQGKKLLIQTSL